MEAGFATVGYMSKVCDLTGKRPMSGHRVSHSNRKTKRKFYPNLQKKRFFIQDENRWVTLQVSTTAIKTINKKGISNYLRELRAAGAAIKI
jgi:large subunit ribosomal protein L28